MYRGRLAGTQLTWLWNARLREKKQKIRQRSLDHCVSATFDTILCRVCPFSHWSPSSLIISTSRGTPFNYKFSSMEISRFSFVMNRVGASFAWTRGNLCSSYHVRNATRHTRPSSPKRNIKEEVAPTFWARKQKAALSATHDESLLQFAVPLNAWISRTVFGIRPGFSMWLQPKC